MARTTSYAHLSQGRFREIWCWGRAVDSTVPTVTIKTLSANVRNPSPGTVPTPGQDCTAYTGRPLGVSCSISHCSHIVAVLDNGVSLSVVVRHLECGNIRVVRVGEVGNVDNERRRPGHVSGIAPEERWAGIESKINECIGIGHGRKSCSILHGLVKRPCIGCAQRSTVWPIEGIGCNGIGRRVNSKDNVDVAERLDKWVKRNILQVLTSVNKSKAGCLGAGIRLVVEVIEWIRSVIRDVVIVPPEKLENTFQDIGKYLRDTGNSTEVENYLVEERRAGAHDEAGIIKSGNASLALGKLSRGKVGAKVAQGGKSIERRVKASHFPRVEFKDSCIQRDEDLARRPLISNQDW